MFIKIRLYKNLSREIFLNRTQKALTLIKLLSKCFEKVKILRMRDWLNNFIQWTIMKEILINLYVIYMSVL